MSFAPSGEQFELVHGDQRAVVVEVGGGIREYTVGGEHVLDGYAEGERCRSGRGQLLLPWPNRLRDGSYEWEGQTQQLPLSEPPNRNAIHGLTRWAGWRLAERSENSVTLMHTLHPQDGYPFVLSLQVTYALADGGLSVRSAATNVGSELCPYGAGAHPYLTVGAERVDSCVLCAPAKRRMVVDERSIPTGSVEVANSDHDFQAPKQIGELRLDTCYCELTRDQDGLARVLLQAPETGRRVTVWLDEAHRYIMLFTGDTLPDESRRRRSLAIEPMTCAPNAFRSGEGLITLQPGESFTSRWGIAPG